MNPTRRTIYPEVRVVDNAKGLVDYVASDESIDSYHEIIRAKGWRFTNFSRNAPFVDSHDYSTIGNQVGKVVDFQVKGDKLIERVQWAKDIPENTLAQLGWKMTEAGFLRAVSVGFWPVKAVNRWDQNQGDYNAQLQQLGIDKDSDVRTIFLEQEQVELSAVIIGANPNALAKAYKADVVSDEELDGIAKQVELRRAFRIFENDERSATLAIDPAAADVASGRGREAWLEKFHKLVRKVS